MDDRSLAYHILSLEETLKLDLKSTLELDNDGKKLEFARDVAAMANTRQPGETDNYLVIGIDDIKSNAQSRVPPYSLKREQAAIEAHGLRMQQILAHRIDPVVNVDYAEKKYGRTECGIVNFTDPKLRPVYVIQEKGWEVWVRRGEGKTFGKDRASRSDLVEMYAERFDKLGVEPFWSEADWEARLSSVTEGVYYDREKGPAGFLFNLLADENPTTVRGAIRELSRIKVSKVLRVWAGQVLHPNPEVAQETLEQLALNGDNAESHNFVSFAFYNDDQEVRAFAARIITRIPGIKTIATLKKALHDDTWHSVRLECAKSLWAIDSQQFYDLLVEVSQNDPDPEVREQIELLIGLKAELNAESEQDFLEGSLVTELEDIPSNASQDAAFASSPNEIAASPLLNEFDEIKNEYNNQNIETQAELPESLATETDNPPMKEPTTLPDNMEFPRANLDVAEEPSQHDNSIPTEPN